jgi:hypothetical protein
MITIKRKIWAGAGVAAAVLATAQAADDPAVGGTFPASKTGETVPFKKALGKVLEGEGGEGGIGFSKSGPTFEAPALTSEQLKLALTGRTIHKDQAWAVYFDPNGTVDGWKRDWSEADKSKCPSELGDNYQIDEGKCWTAVVNPLKGPYTFKDGQVCMPAYSGKPADGQACYYIGFVTKFVMVGDGKRTYGSGKDLVEGKHLEVFLKKKEKE